MNCVRFLFLHIISAQDTKAYERDPAITSMTQLTEAYLANDIAVRAASASSCS
jgi:hypothetical protein